MKHAGLCQHLFLSKMVYGSGYQCQDCGAEFRTPDPVHPLFSVAGDAEIQPGACVGIHVKLSDDEVRKLVDYLSTKPSGTVPAR